MTTSQNGWPANDRSLVASRPVPGTQVRLTVRKDTAGDLLLWVAAQFDARVEDIDTATGVPDDWGYAERPIRGTTTTVSNHASGTAIDLNATRHPLGVPTAGTFTQEQIAEVHRILAEASGAVRWGGDYKSRPDAMHFEIHTTPAAVAAAWKRILDRTPKPTPPAPPEDDVTKDEIKDAIRELLQDEPHLVRAPLPLLTDEHGIHVLHLDTTTKTHIADPDDVDWLTAVATDCGRAVRRYERQPGHMHSGWRYVPDATEPAPTAADIARHLASDPAVLDSLAGAASRSEVQAILDAMADRLAR